MKPLKLGRNPFVRAVLPRGSKRRTLVAKAVRRVRALTPLRKKPHRAEVSRLQEEAKLKRVWSRHLTEMLDIYLVSGFQDPRLNAQSIIGRHTLVRALFGSEFETLMREELAHAAELNDAIRLRGLEQGVRLTATMNPELQAGVQRVMESVADRLPIFAGRWQEALSGREATPLRVIEFACGSANDYRAFADYGIARFLDYTGIDLNVKNVANARRRFPEVDFRVGSILSLPEKRRSVDYVIGYDILEHLSLQGMQTVLETAERIARRGLYFAFFRMDEVPEHEEHLRGNYHYNLLSVDRMREHMEQRYASVQLIHIAKMFEDEYGYPHSYDYNRRAYSLIAEDPLPATGRASSYVVEGARALGRFRSSQPR
ncbi:MAG: class I SAM-dependent methyltransferase [Propionibacteriaceae bacterium]|nr:class I SAM-dependent methyltransferase [Propionibacteriaceae bacterium]